MHHAGKARARTVLIVDDEPMIRSFARCLLEPLGYEVVEAGTGPEALALVAQPSHHVDAVLLDLGLPGMDGAAVLRALRKDDAHLPVVVQSGRDLAETESGLLQLGASAVLEKPYRAADLVRVLAEAMAHAKRAQA